MRVALESGDLEALPARKPAPVLLTVLMPCLDEARTLPACIGKAQAALTRLNVRGEVLVADNGSTDGSPELAKACGARVISVAERGYGAALRAGIEAARGRYIIMADADESYDFDQLEPYLTALQGGADLVMGNRFAGGIAPGAMPWHHQYIGNPALSFLGRLLFKTPVRDFHCGMRGFDRSVIRRLDLSSTGMEFASEMVVKAQLAQLTIAEVPTTLRPDGRNRPPHLRSFRDGWRHLKFLLLHCPRWLLWYPGLAMFAAGWILLLAIAVRPLAIAGVTLDIHTMLYAGALALLGAQTLSFAWLGSTAAWNSGLLPAPNWAARVRAATLERWLLVGLGVFGCGLMLGAVALAEWTRTGFWGLDPALVMRITIPSAFLLASGMQVMFTGLMAEILRLAQARRA